MPDGARQCQAVPERADKQSAQTYFDAFQCTCPGGHLQQRARSGRLFRMGAGKTDEHPAGCGTAKARRPGVPDGSTLPTLIYPGTLAYPHVSASSAFLPTLLRRSHEATARVPPLACEPLSLPTHCLLPLALSQAPAACECANLTKFQGCGWWMHIATHRTLDSTLWPLPLSQRFPAALLREWQATGPRDASSPCGQAHARRTVCRSSNHGCCSTPSPPFTLLNFCC